MSPLRGPPPQNGEGPAAGQPQVLKKFNQPADNSPTCSQVQARRTFSSLCDGRLEDCLDDIETWAADGSLQMENVLAAIERLAEELAMAAGSPGYCWRRVLAPEILNRVDSLEAEAHSIHGELENIEEQARAAQKALVCDE